MTNFADRTIWTGDNLDILRGLNSASVDLIYLDPPFNSNRNYAAPVGSAAADAAFKDTWTLSDLDVAWMGLIADEQPAIYKVLDTYGLSHGKPMQSYLCMMAVRLMEMHRVMKETASVYLHCDPTASHYLKMLMDAVFGSGLFLNEMTWKRSSAHSDTRQGMRRAGKIRDVSLVYTKSADYVWNPQYMPYTDDYLLAEYRHISPDGLHETGMPRLMQFAEDMPGVPLQDLWDDIPPVLGNERIGYPTQKPLALVERIIKASSNAGDVVLDPFCGCATACVAAENLGRRWIGIDISPKAVELVNMRLQQSMGDLFHNRLVTARTDIPRRTDIDAPVPYRQNKHVLFGQQEGRCNGCRSEFPFRNFTIDHIIAERRGGTDHIENLQLLCGHCNSVKGDRPQEYLVARLRELGVAA